MKVLHVIKSLGLGGAERLLVDGARVGPTVGLRHEIVSFLPWKDALIPDLQRVGARVTVLPASSSPSLLLNVDRLARHLKVVRPDVVHAHLPVACVVARLAARQAGIPCVITEHNVLERYHPLTRALTLSTWPLQAAAVACSDEVAASIARHVPGTTVLSTPPSYLERRGRGVPPPVVVVRNGIPVERYAVDESGRREMRTRLGLISSSLVVGTVAVQRTQKALDRWLEIARQVADVRPDAAFVLVGDGPERNRLERLSSGLGLDGKVHFVGLQTDPVPWLSAMDVFLSTSIFEGLPLALLEAMANERPVVATAVGGVPEVLTDHLTGRILDKDDVDGLRDAVLAYLDDEDLRRRTGTTARLVVEERFSVEQMQRTLRDLYEAVCC